eukprot:1159784-Pelagomonas_calceolata.AAC.4
MFVCRYGSQGEGQKKSQSPKTKEHSLLTSYPQICTHVMSPRTISLYDTRERQGNIVQQPPLNHQLPFKETEAKRQN